MAGRPVTTRGGLTGAHWGMIIFAILATVFLGLSIFLMTGLKEADSRRQAAAQKEQFYGTPPTYYANEANARGTSVFAVVNEDVRRVAAAVTGQPEDVGPTIVAKAERLLGDVADRKRDVLNAGDTLLTALGKLDKAHSDARAEADAARIVISDLQQEVENLTAQLKATRDEFEAQTAAFSRQLEQVQAEKVSALQQKDEQLRDVQATLDAREQLINKLKTEGLRALRDAETEILRLENQIAALQKQVKDLKPATFDPNAILAKADGRILRAVPGSDVVYINLGAADKVKVGQGFEVYSQTGEMPATLRGKASIEVVTLMEETAECRITRRSPNAPIVEGDIIVNIAYERGRQPKFVVRGEFDLNYDGQIDFDGIEQVTAIIRQWGGQVVPELDETVDVVVIGVAPTVPTFGRDERVSDVVRDQAAQKEAQLARFRNLVDQAGRMYIPVITQNQFLFLMGYAGDARFAYR